MSSDLQKYREFMAVENKRQMGEFYRKYYESPAGLVTYTPSNYHPRFSPLRIELDSVHESLRGYFGRIPDDKAYRILTNWFSIANFDDYNFYNSPVVWAKSRYDIPDGSYLVRTPYEYYVASLNEIKKNEADETEEAKDEAAKKVKALEDGNDYVAPSIPEDRPEILYTWKKVGHTKESYDRLRAHLILVDKVTGLEAPLLPGVKPYSD